MVSYCIAHARRVAHAIRFDSPAFIPPIFSQAQRSRDGFFRILF